MARFWGLLGLNRGYTETAPGTFTNVIDEVEVNGEMRRQNLKWSNAGMRDSISAKTTLSVVTPEDSVIDFAEAVYVIWLGKKWSIIGIDYIRPRVELTLGGLYNG